MQMLSIDAITLDERCQPRASMSLELIGDYARAMTEGSEFPPLTVYRDGSTYYLADGFHRIAAAQDAGLKHIVCEVIPGDIRDAILHAVGANSTHGQRRTNLDKHRAVETLLNDPEWVQWSNVQIADRCAVSEGLVRSLRPIFVQNEDAPRLATRNGTTYEVNTANIGRTPKSAPVAMLEPDEDVDEDTGEIIASEQEPIAPPADRARMIAAGLVQANGVAFARRIAAAVYDMTGGKT